jgi:type II secretory pathway pseudopilin PulG
MDVYDNYNAVVFLSAYYLRPQAQPKTLRVSGFSQLELLIVICLLGIFSSLAIAWYNGNNRDVIERVINQRNAQEIVSIGVCATMGGAEFVVSGDKLSTAINLTVGVTGQQGVWKDKLFRLGNLAPTDLPGAMPFVKFEDGLLLYDPEGLQP